MGSLLKQLAIANKSVGGGVVVVLAERDKEEMELDIAKLEFDFMGTSVICISDSPLILADLKKVSVSKAHAPCPYPEVCAGYCPKTVEPPKYPEKILFCGWRWDIDDMIMVLEAFLPPGSELWMFNEVPEKERDKKLTDGGLDVSRLENIKLIHREGNAVIKRHLEKTLMRFLMIHGADIVVAMLISHYSI